MVAAVCLRDASGLMLAVRKRGTSAFMLPGGKIEAGETPLQCALRELHEEVGLELASAEPLGHFLDDAANEPGHLVDATVFAADLAPNAPLPAPIAEIDELRWLDPAALPVDVPLAPVLVRVAAQVIAG